jgi:HSP20 family molecular chaperone IbpA
MSRMALLDGSLWLSSPAMQPRTISIAARQFKRTFLLLLASGVEVRGAELNEGLLAVELVRPRKEKRVLKVGIAAAD